MIYRTEVNTGSGGFGFDNHTLQDAKNDIRDYVSMSAFRKFSKWISNHKNQSKKKFKFENLNCELVNSSYCYIQVL